MRKVFLVTVSVLGVSSQAYGADLPEQSPAPVPPVYTWDGLYIGGNFGFGTAHFSDTLSDFGLQSSSNQSNTGGIGGGQIGYNKTFDKVLVGLETDFQATGISANQGMIQSDLSWFGTTRLRSGVLFTPQWLAYATGGVAYGQAKLTAQQAFIPVSGTVDGIGWIVGAGVELALGHGWFFGAEYLHMHLDGSSANLGNVSLSTNTDVDLGRAKIDFKF